MFYFADDDIQSAGELLNSYKTSALPVIKTKRLFVTGKMLIPFF